MSQEREQLPPSPSTDESPVDAAVLEAARAAIVARGGKTREMTVMSYPPALLTDLMTRLVDHRQKMEATLTWLGEECLERDLAVPGKSAFYDFARLVREQYRLAFMLDRRKQAENYVAAATNGSGDAQQMALNMRLTELLTDALMSAGSAGEIETDRLVALINGVKAVAAVAFDKQKMDARIKALEKLNQERDAAIALKNQQLEKREAELAAEKAKQAQAVKAAEGAAGKGGASAKDVVATIKRALGIKVEEAA